MSRPSHDEYFLQMLALVASRSTCVRRQVGAIIVDEGHHVLSTGYNGVPRGFSHCTAKPCEGAEDQKGDSSRCLAVHAEQNALLQCHRPDLAFKMYTTCAPCFMCAKMIANTKIQEVVSLEEYADARGLDVFLKAGIKFTVIDGQER